MTSGSLRPVWIRGQEETPIQPRAPFFRHLVATTWEIEICPVFAVNDISTTPRGVVILSCGMDPFPSLGLDTSSKVRKVQKYDNEEGLQIQFPCMFSLLCFSCEWKVNISVG